MKLEAKIANALHETLLREYNLSIKPSVAIGMARVAINESNQHAVRIKSQKSPLDAIHQSYFDTTKLPQSEIRGHSSYWFMTYLKNNYSYFFFDKSKWRHRLLYKVTKRLL